MPFVRGIACCMIFVERFIIATSHGLKNEEASFKAMRAPVLGEINEEAPDKRKCRNSEMRRKYVL